MSKFFFLMIVFFYSQVLLSAGGGSSNPPPPTPPGPPGLSIDGYFVALVFIALITGYYLSQKYILNRKGSF